MPTRTRTLRTQRTPQNKTLELLESRRLFATIEVTSFGAKPSDGDDDTAGVKAAISAASVGDTVHFASGEYNFDSHVEVRSGITLKGDGGEASVLNFDIGRDYGFVIKRSARNVRITGLGIHSSGGGILMGGGLYENVHILKNDFVYAGRKYGVFIGVKNQGTLIEQNHFHDSLEGMRNINVWEPNDFSYSYNTMYLVSDGGHILSPRNNVTVSFNAGRKVHRMGIEIQENPGVIATNMTVEGNVFSDWYLPYNDTFGLSVMPQRGKNIRIINNYLSADPPNGPWGNPTGPGQGNRYGFAIEAGFTTGTVSGNTIIGPWAAGVAASMPNTPVTNNKFFGKPKWTWIMGEPGWEGIGSFISSGNIFDSDVGNAPPPPIIVPGSGGGGGGTPDPEPQPGGGLAPRLSAFAPDSKTIYLAWNDLRSDEDGYALERSLDGRQYTVIFDSRVPNAKNYTDQNLPANTGFWYRVHSYKGDEKGKYSNVVFAKTKAGSGGGFNFGGGGGTGRGFGSSGFGGSGGEDDLFGDNPIV